MSIVREMPFSKYFAAEGMNQSRLKKINESPEKFKYLCENPTPQTPAMITGRQVHSFVLEPETFFDTYTLDGPINAKTGKMYGAGTKAYSSWVKDNPGIEPIDTDTINILKKMREKIAGHDVARQILKQDYKKEVSVFWEGDGIPQKCRIDYCNLDTIKAGDLKTTQCADPKSFIYDIIKFGYDFQAAMSLTALELETGNRWDSWTILAIEKDPPYAIEVIPLGESFISRGRVLYADAIRKYKMCVKNNYWPGYTTEIKYAECPDRYQLLGDI